MIASLGMPSSPRLDRSRPFHAHHADGLERWHVKEQSWAGAVQAFGFAGKHRPARFEFAAFGLLEYTAIKQAENALALRFEPLYLFVGFLKQKAINVPDAPFERARASCPPAWCLRWPSWRGPHSHPDTTLIHLTAILAYGS